MSSLGDPARPPLATVTPAEGPGDLDQIRALFRVRADDVEEIRERLAAILGALEDQLRESPDEILARQLLELRGTVAALGDGLRRVAAEVARGRLRAQMAV